MKGQMRPEVSDKNPYWIERHRYYELRHFCLQYPIWKKARAALTSLAQRPDDLEASGRASGISDPTAKCAEARLFYTDRIEMVEAAAKEADPILADYILKGVTQDLSYEKINAISRVPCGKDAYYIFYRRFFWILNKLRQ